MLNLHRDKIVRRELRKYGKMLSDHRQHGNVACWGPSATSEIQTTDNSVKLKRVEPDFEVQPVLPGKVANLPRSQLK